MVGAVNRCRPDRRKPHRTPPLSQRLLGAAQRGCCSTALEAVVAAERRGPRSSVVGAWAEQTRGPEGGGAYAAPRLGRARDSSIAKHPASHSPRCEFCFQKGALTSRHAHSADRYAVAGDRTKNARLVRFACGSFIAGGDVASGGWQRTRDVPGVIRSAARERRRRHWILALAIYRSTTMTGCPPSQSLNLMSAMN
jgi:hypothetical protein